MTGNIEVPTEGPIFVPPDDSGSGFPCDECEKVCKTSHALRMHKRFSHGAEADREPSGKPNKPRKRFSAPRAPRTSTRTSDGQLREAAKAWVLMFYGMGGGIMVQVSPDWGMAVASCSNEQMVDAWVAMAKRHKVIRDMLLSGEAVSTYAMFVAAHQPIIQLAQTKVMSGFVPPDDPDPMAHPAPGSPAEKFGAEPAPSWPDAA